MPLESCEGLRRLRAEFEEVELLELQSSRQKAGAIEHLRVSGLPCLGATHASLCAGQIHLAPALGQQLRAKAGSIALVPGGIATQAYRCCQILEQVLLAAGSSTHEVVRLTCYVSKLTSRSSDVLQEVIDLFCHERSCRNITRTVIGCDRLQADAAVQIEGLAMADERSRTPRPRPVGHRDWSVEKTLRREAHSIEAGDKAAAAATAYVPEDQSWIMVEDSSASRRTKLQGFYGHLSSFELYGLTPEEAESVHSGLADFTEFCRLTMKGPEDYRTIRLEPSVILCREAGYGTRSTWSFSFALVVEKSVNCFVNVGLVEWIAARKDAEEAAAAEAQSLADLLKVKSEAEDKVPGGWLPEQHVHENPRQMMLGCRKGVQWFGNAAKFPLFQDNIMEGSLLRFRCDYHLNRKGEIAQVKVWFLPSLLHFEYGGEYTITESDLWFEPLAQWWEPRCQDKKMRSLWVPAVTLYTCDDVVTVAWNSPDAPHVR